MKIAKIIIQILFGAIFLVFGLNKLFAFIEMPPSPEASQQFLGALIESGFAWTIIAIVEIIAGIMLLVHRFSALALLLLAPLTVNILFHNILLDPQAAPAGIIVAILHLVLFFVYYDKYKPVLKAR